MERIAIWARQFEITDEANPALPFIRETQVQGHYIACLLALALYKPAAGAMRAAVECSLYYSYFRTHPVELRTLVGDTRFYMDKREILEFHRAHTPRFREKEQSLGLLSRLEDWYSETSAIVHGQIPGKWVTHTDLSKIAPDARTSHLCVTLFERGERILHELLLVTTPDEMWLAFSRDAKRALLKGLPGNIKEVLKL